MKERKKNILTMMMMMRTIFLGVLTKTTCVCMCDSISVVSHCKHLLYTSLALILKGILLASFLNTVFRTSLVSSFLFRHLHPVSDGSHLQASSSGAKTSWSLLLSGMFQNYCAVVVVAAMGYINNLKHLCQRSLPVSPLCR